MPQEVCVNGKKLEEGTDYEYYESQGKIETSVAVGHSDVDIYFVSEEITRRPIAKFYVNKLGAITGETLTFDATPSTDPDGEILLYLWDFGDGEFAYGGKDQCTVTHSYSIPGTYGVILTVRDNDDLIDIEYKLIKICAAPSPNYIIVTLSGPCDLLIKDVQERRLGYEYGILYEEIPGGEQLMDDGWTETYLINNPPSILFYYIQWTGSSGSSTRARMPEDTYNLIIARTQNAVTTTVTATDITLNAGQTHRYYIDWDIIAPTKGVTVLLDGDGDGVFETIIEAGMSIVQDDVADSDFDGMPDNFELRYEFDPNDPTDASLDYDEDGLTNLQEYLNNTKPNTEDTDEDGIPDEWEIRYGLDPLDNTDATSDNDKDGISAIDEYRAGTDPTDPKSKPPVVRPITIMDYLIYIVIAIVVIICVVVGIVVYRRRKKRIEEEKERERIRREEEERRRREEEERKRREEEEARKPRIERIVEKPKPPPAPPKPPEVKKFKCSICGAIVREDETSCPGCGATFEEEAPPGPPPPPAPPKPPAKPAEKFKCSICGELVRLDATECPGCGAVFEE
jgi:PKD repeat protein/rubrerythrin